MGAYEILDASIQLRSGVTPNSLASAIWLSAMLPISTRALQTSRSPCPDDVRCANTTTQGALLGTVPSVLLAALGDCPAYANTPRSMPCSNISRGLSTWSTSNMKRPLRWMPASTLRFIVLVGSFFRGVSSKSLAPKISGGSDSFKAVAHLASFSSSVSC